MELPGGAFVPPPKVSVGLVKMVPHHEPFIKDLPFHFVNKVVTGLFLNKNQKYLNSIRTNLIPVKVSFPKSRADVWPCFLPVDGTVAKLPNKKSESLKVAAGGVNFPRFLNGNPENFSCY